MKSFLRRHWLFELIWGSLALLFLLSYLQLQRPIPKIAVSQTLPESRSFDDSQLALPWPAVGSAAVSVDGVGLVGSARDDRPRAIASLVKVMTAYVVLKDHALNPGETGPSVDVQQSDVDTYKAQNAQGESVVEVRKGTSLSELELLEGLLIPSGNNLAYMLAGWSSGSVDAFVARMNEEARALGMNDTKYADPSGASAASRSTARDQLKLAEAAMANPVFAALVGQKQAVLPTAGVVYNVNSLVGQDGIVGIKTGWTEEAGACFMLATDRQVGDRAVRIFTVTLGQDTLADAFAATRAMVGGVGPGLQLVQVVSRELPAASVTSRWGGRADASPAADASFVLWPGLAVATQFEPATTLSKKVKDGDEVGKLVVTAGGQRQEVPVLAKGALLPASVGWRLTRLR